jgi:ATP-dependent Clp protease ATP-binding subunit ClpX
MILTRVPSLLRLLHCSFCGKSEREIQKLVAGPGGIHICDECVDVCRLVMEGEAVARDFAPSAWPTERLLALIAPLNATQEAHRRHLGDVVDTLRARKVSWAAIAKPLGITRQSAWERFG